MKRDPIRDHPYPSRWERKRERENVWIFRCDYYLKTSLEISFLLHITHGFFERKWTRRRRRRQKRDLKWISSIYIDWSISFEWSNLSIIIHNHQCIHFVLHAKRNNKKRTNFIHAKRKKAAQKSSNKASRSRGEVHSPYNATLNHLVSQIYKSRLFIQIYGAVWLKSFFTLCDESTHEKNIIINFYSWKGI